MEFVEENWESLKMEENSSVLEQKKCEMPIVYDVEMWEGNGIYEYTVQDNDPE